MIGIVVALEKEAESFLALIENKKEFLLAGKKSYEFDVENKHIVLTICGVGKVNSALITQILIDKYSPEFIINFGTAGGFYKKTELLEYYVATKCCQYDFDLSELDNVPIGYIQDYDIVFFPTYTDGLDFLKKGVLASGDRFTDNKTDIKNILEMECNLRDMEGGAIAHVCLANKVEFISIKGITDLCGNSTNEFPVNLAKVCQNFGEIMLKVLKSIKK